MNRLRRYISLFILTLCAVIGPEIKASASLSWVTFGPGNDVYELEGHTGIRIVDGNRDVIVNWGLFDFNSPGFVWRFALGKTDYLMGLIETAPMIAAYTHEGRYVKELPLNLDSIATQRFIELVDSTLQPGRNVYRYSYCHDNCATRPLDYLRKATGGRIIIPGEDEMTETTIRSEMQRYHSDYPWYQFGIDLALGAGIDKKITELETGFAPVKMHEILKTATFEDGTPVADHEVSMNYIPDMAMEHDTTFLTPLLVAILIFVCTLISVLSTYHKPHQVRWFTSLFFAVEFWAGCIIAFLVFVSTHYATSTNWVILWLNPLSIIAAVGIWITKAQKILAIYNAANIIALLVLTIIFIAGVQTANVAFWPLMASSALLSADYLRRHFINKHKSQRA